MKENFPKIFSIGSSPKKNTLLSCRQFSKGSYVSHGLDQQCCCFFFVPVKDDVLESGHNIYLKMCVFFLMSLLMAHGDPCRYRSRLAMMMNRRLFSTAARRRTGWCTVCCVATLIT